jgi:hypothetical protein
MRELVMICGVKRNSAHRGFAPLFRMDWSGQVNDKDYYILYKIIIDNKFRARHIYLLHVFVCPLRRL